MRLWPKSRPKQASLCCALVLTAYLVSYLILSALGGYRFDQSGELRYASAGLSVSDLVMWHPAGCWYQRRLRGITGDHTSRGNFLGYLYSPLIVLDRALVHRTKRIIDKKGKFLWNEDKSPGMTPATTPGD